MILKQKVSMNLRKPVLQDPKRHDFGANRLFFGCPSIVIKTRIPRARERGCLCNVGSRPSDGIIVSRKGGQEMRQFRATELCSEATPRPCLTWPRRDLVGKLGGAGPNSPVRDMSGSHMSTWLFHVPPVAVTAASNKADSRGRGRCHRWSRHKPSPDGPRQRR